MSAVMATPNRKTRALYTRLKEVLGNEHADTLMTYLPLEPGRSLATNDDIAGLEARLDQRFELPISVDAGRFILVHGQTGNQVTVSRFAPGQPDQSRTVSSDVEDVIRAIVELGGSYPDVVQALQEAKEAGSLSGRLRVDALPEGGRRFERATTGDNEMETATPKRFHVPSPLPNLFYRWNRDSKAEGKNVANKRNSAQFS